MEKILLCRKWRRTRAIEPHPKDGAMRHTLMSSGVSQNGLMETASSDVTRRGKRYEVNVVGYRGS